MFELYINLKYKQFPGLKVLERIFHRPMKERQILPQDQLQLLFANLEQMFELHSQFCNAMKTIRKENRVVQNIGHVLLTTVCINLLKFLKKKKAFSQFFYLTIIFI